MKKFGIDANHVVSHYDVCAKNCPSAIRAKGDWNRFKQLIGAKTAATTVDKYYRIRKTWGDSKSQIGAYKNLENAKKNWKEGYTIFDWNGKAVYPEQKKDTSSSETKVSLTEKLNIQLPVLQSGAEGSAVRCCRQYSELPLMEILERIPRRHLKHSRRMSASMMMVAVARIHGRKLLTT